MRQHKSDLQVSLPSGKGSLDGPTENMLQFKLLLFMDRPDPATLINEICPLLGISSSLQFPFVLTAEWHFMVLPEAPVCLLVGDFVVACVTRSICSSTTCDICEQ